MNQKITRAKPLEVKSGYITLCAYCGDQVGNSQVYCENCKKQEDRIEIFKNNVRNLMKLGIKKEEAMAMMPNPIKSR